MTTITITVKQLVELATTNTLTKFYNLGKPVSVSWPNRKQPAICNEELKNYNERRHELCELHGKKDPKTGNYLFDVGDDLLPLPGVPVPGPQRRAFDEAFAELLAQTIDLPGEPIHHMMLKGDLSDIECAMLEPFIVD